MGKKGVAAAVFVGLLLLVGVYANSRYHRTPAHLLSGAVDETGAFKHTETDEFWNIEVTMPHRTGLWRWWSGAADTRVCTSIETWLRTSIEEFKQNARPQSLPSLDQQMLRERGGYTYSAQYKHFNSVSDKLSSYEYSVYVDTGGAHPNGYFKTFVFDANGIEIKLPDLFVPGSDYLDRIATSSLAQITKDLTDRLSVGASNALFEEGLEPKEENFSNFVIDSDTLVFLFPPYQVAPYAAGDFEVRIPLSEFADILRPEWK